jgi:vacuolar-type H+-ATPase subunit F/Vma7
MAADDAPVFIGDDVTGLGYRLAGAIVMSPPPDDVERALEEAAARARVVLLTAEHAAMLSPRALARARERSALLVVVPDARERAPLPDLAAQIRAALVTA